MFQTKNRGTLLAILKVHLSSLAVFSTFRVLLFLAERKHLDPSTRPLDILRAFLMGVRFDAVIASAILALPFLALTALTYLDRRSGTPLKICFLLPALLFPLAFLVCAADLAYFHHFFSRLSVAAFQWLDSPWFVAKMVAQEPRYWGPLLPFFILVFYFHRTLRWIWRKELGTPFPRKGLAWEAGVTILFIALMALTIRGRVSLKSPLRIGTAYFSTDPFLNQLGLNADYTLLRSLYDKEKHGGKAVRFMDPGKALGLVQKSLGIVHPDPDFPLLREVPGDPRKRRDWNVVVVIMESMSADKMGRHGNPKGLTPFLDDLTTRGLYFENIYTAGIHTFNGIFSTLFSYPALARRHPMKEGIRRFHGLSRTLRELGYSTVYFTTHDGQFDNAEGFLMANDFERVVSQKDYPAKEVKSALGVPDDFMFGFSMPLLDDLAGRGKPFFAAFRTSADHGPYYIPDYYKPRTRELRDQIVEYADWTLEKFMDLCSRKAWFERTLFVFIADHGSSMDRTYEAPLSYNHSPLLFYGPKILPTPRTDPAIGGQIDIYPTILGLLNQPYRNNTLGIDLLKEKRPYIYFNSDDKYGVIDDQWFLILRGEGKPALYRYRKKDKRDLSEGNPEVVARMKEYAEANLQAFQTVVAAGKQDDGRPAGGR